MALSNAERQKRYRQKRLTQVSEIEELRNVIQALNADNEQLRNDLNMAIAELKQLRNESAKLSRTETHLEHSSNQPDPSLWEHSPYSSEPLLKPFKVPSEHAVLEQSFAGFRRRTKDLWTYSADNSNSSWKTHYRIQIANGQLQLQPPVVIGEKIIATFDDWSTMASNLELVVSMN